MAVVTPPIDNNNLNLHASVYYKWAWSGPWRPAPYFEPLNAVYAAAPTISTATFKTCYGSGYWEDLEVMVNGNILQSYAYCYIQIRIRRGTDETIIWTGLIPAETFHILGKSGLTRTADQVIQAYGLEVLLKKRLDGAWVQPVGGGNAKWVDNVPIFNKRHEYGGSVVGNRSDSKHTYDNREAYIFSDSGQKWNNYDICENLLAFYGSPDSNQNESGPNFCLSIESNLKSVLMNIVSVYNFNAFTVLEALNVLISRSRGFAWYIRVTKNSESNEDGVNIVPVSMLDAAIQSGEFSMPANPNRISLDLWSEQDFTNVEVVGDISHVYDRIIVRGARMKSCCSLSFANGGLERGWSTGEENAFKNAAKNSDGYGDLNNTAKAERNDKYRAEDKFERVFTTLRIPRDWGWKLSGYFVNPLLDTAGDLILYQQAAYWNADKRFMNSLPFKIGFDYSGSGPADNNVADAEPEYRRLFVLVRDKDGKYQYADRLKPAGAAVRPMTREMGVSVRFRPQYIAAKNHWNGAEPSELSHLVEDIGIDYQDSIVTAFFETDQFVEIEHIFNFYENQRVLTIDIPDAELWYVVPGTIIGVDEDGNCIEYGGSSNILRDDRARLKAALNTAIAWYGRERNKVVINIRTLDPAVPVGTVIENVDVAGVGAGGSVVTGLSWDFQTSPAVTVITTDFCELDIAGIFRGLK